MMDDGWTNLISSSCLTPPCPRTHSSEELPVGYVVVVADNVVAVVAVVICRC